MPHRVRSNQVDFQVQIASLIISAFKPNCSQLAFFFFRFASSNMPRHFSPKLTIPEDSNTKVLARTRRSQKEHSVVNSRNATQRRNLEEFAVTVLVGMTQVHGARVASKTLYDQLRNLMSKKREALGYYDRLVLERIFNRNNILVMGPGGLEEEWLEANPHYKVVEGTDPPLCNCYSPAPGLIPSLVKYLEESAPSIPVPALASIKKGVVDFVKGVKQTFVALPGGNGTIKSRRAHVWGVLFADEINQLKAPTDPGLVFRGRGPAP